MTIEEKVIGVLREIGDMGATASQIAEKIGRKREVVSHYLWILKKMGKVNNKGRDIWVLSKEVLDPFNITMEKFKSLTFDEYVQLASRAYELCKGKVIEIFKKSSAQHIVISNGEIIYSSKEIAGIPSNIINKITKKSGKPCYIFSREDMVEEVAWIKTNGDHYPTIELYIGPLKLENFKVVKLGRKVTADFDTGNPYYIFLDEKLCEKIVPGATLQEFHRGIHFGSPYWYFVRKIKICIKDIKDKLASKILLVRLVKNWKKSPLILANPNREGFVGRNLMFEFNFKVTLNPKTCTSVVEFLGS